MRLTLTSTPRHATVGELLLVRAIISAPLYMIIRNKVLLFFFLTPISHLQDKQRELVGGRMPPLRTIAARRRG